LQPGDREAIRIPFALALFAHGDASYAGIELRRAHNLYEDFARVSIDAGELFGSRAALARLASRVTRERPEGDGAEVQAALAYVLHLSGDAEAASSALGSYAKVRGEDGYVRALRARQGEVAKKPASAPTPAAAEGDLWKRVEQMDAVGRPPAPRMGEPARAGTKFQEPAVRPRGEIFEP
jgi:hypothetical protein